MQSVSVAVKVGSNAEMPGISSRQQHRFNAGAQTPKEYFKRNVAIALLDHIVMSINEQFSPSAAVTTSLFVFVPCVLYARDVDLKAAPTKS